MAPRRERARQRKIELKKKASKTNEVEERY